MFTFSPLQGAFSESPATQSLLELDGGVKLLVGLGWDASFDVEKLRELEKQVSSQSISLILLTHATVGHLAAYAHCCKNFPRFTQIPVYATRPVIDLGRTLIQDLYESAPHAATLISETSLTETSFTHAPNAATFQNLLLQPPSSEEIAKYFSLIQPLKYSQPHQPVQTPGTPPLNGLTITAYNSGRTLGGTIWHIQHGMESIVYAVDWNQARENVFAGAAWLGGAGSGGAEVIEQLRQPTALICSSKGATKPSLGGGRAKRDEQLVETAKSIALSGGTVLIPVDSSARVLEIAYLLEHSWRTSNDPILEGIQLFLTGRSMSSTLRYASTMLEWMDDNINREFEAINDRNQANNDDKMRDENSGEARNKSTGPFHFKYIRVLERKAQIEKLLQMTLSGDALRRRGRIILATDTTLEWGFSKDLLVGLARDPRNAIILTEKPNTGKSSAGPSTISSISGILFDWWQERGRGSKVESVPGADGIEVVYGAGREVCIKKTSRKKLEGDDLELYQQWLTTRTLQSQVEAGGPALEATADVADEESDSSDSEDESDSEQQGKSLNISATLNQANRRNVILNDEDLGVNILIKKKGIYDYEVEGRKGRDRFFPIPIRRKRTDDYGDLIRPEAYLRAEERVDPDAPGPMLGRGSPDPEEDMKLGKKRKWNDQGSAPYGAANKRPYLSRTPSGDGGAGPTDELDAAEDVPDPAPSSEPAKLVVESVSVTVNMRIAFVDMEGIHDKRSLNMLIPLIKPRKLILIGGSHDETTTLANDCRRLLSGNHSDNSSRDVVVLTPSVGMVVDASVDTNAWSLKLADALVRKIKWQTVKGLSVATINGQLLGVAADSGPAPSKKLKSADSDPDMLATSNPVPEPKIVPTLDLVHGAASASAARAMTQPLHVGDLRLAEIRRAMQMSGHSAEFRGEGTLVVDGSVAVRKTAAGRIEVERVGVDVAVGAGDRKRSSFAEVMKVVYENLAVVAGA
ncbi:hypothetical protein TD95_000548 [Thielaviopsis punctulata]|uniref:Cleavage and polyadenylation specificity factor subunit 2 n=1 Tax=Thielaviopsis punctulata TaxID=72032 RepID=A0A0F4Z916_9PEZI|nr:hypothetical protein TD95_000548 [Thielaviopsis punctulata]